MKVEINVHSRVDYGFIEGVLEVLKMIKIISDSTCDLSQEVLERYGIDIIPLHIVKGNEELEDGPAIDISALYKWADENKTTPKTSAPSIETAMNIMRPYIEAGRELSASRYPARCQHPGM